MWISWRAGHIQTSAFVPCDLRRLHESVALRGEKIYRKTIGQSEGRQFLFRRECFRFLRAEALRARDRWRHRFAARERVNAIIRGEDQSVQPLKIFFQRYF